MKEHGLLPSSLILRRFGAYLVLLSIAATCYGRCGKLALSQSSAKRFHHLNVERQHQAFFTAAVERTGHRARFSLLGSVP